MACGGGVRRCVLRCMAARLVQDRHAAAAHGKAAPWPRGGTADRCSCRYGGAHAHCNVAECGDRRDGREAATARLRVCTPSCTFQPRCTTADASTDAPLPHCACPSVVVPACGPIWGVLRVVERECQREWQPTARQPLRAPPLSASHAAAWQARTCAAAGCRGRAALCVHVGRARRRGEPQRERLALPSAARV